MGGGAAVFHSSFFIKTSKIIGTIFALNIIHVQWIESLFHRPSYRTVLLKTALSIVTLYGK